MYSELPRHDLVAVARAHRFDPFGPEDGFDPRPENIAGPGQLRIDRGGVLHQVSEHDVSRPHVLRMGGERPPFEQGPRVRPFFAAFPARIRALPATAETAWPPPMSLPNVDKSGSTP